MLFTVVIPFWKRVDELFILLKSLNGQASDEEMVIEVIVADSNSCEEVFAVIQKAKINFNNLIIKHIHTLNILAKKRNDAIKLACGEYLIFLDDDCIPAKNFLKTCISYTKSMDNYDVMCGEIRFLEEKVVTSNYFRYRDSRHPRVDAGKFKELNQWTFVAMNYLIKRETVLLEEVYYNENYIGYGAEDHDYGYLLLNKNFKIYQGGQKIWHYELSGNIKTYAHKIYKCSIGGMAILAEINPGIENTFSTKQILFLRIFGRKNLLGSLLRSLFFNNFLYSIIIVFLIKNDAKKSCYFNFLYRYVIISSVVKGLQERGSINFDKLKDNWYE